MYHHFLLQRSNGRSAPKDLFHAFRRFALILVPVAARREHICVPWRKRDAVVILSDRQALKCKTQFPVEESMLYFVYIK